MENERKNCLCVIYLASCAIRGEKPDFSRLAGTDMGALFVTAYRHSMAACTYYALESAKCDGLPDRWREERDRAIYKNMLFDAERARLTAFLDENGIWYMPLKGSVLHDMYPLPGMRQMADNDILYDKAYCETVRDWFSANGYDTKAYGEDACHDAYMKMPLYNFEMHRWLFADGYDPLFVAYYADIEKRLLPDPDTGKCAKKLCDEDFYVYIITHAAKHFENSGTGLRTLMDIYVMLAKLPGLDFGRIGGELRALGIEKTEKTMRGLALKLFSDSGEDLSEDETALFDELTVSATYGTQALHVEKAFKKIQPEGKVGGMTRVKYLVKRVFPGVKHFKKLYPACKRHPCLIPFFWVHRTLSCLNPEKRARIAEEARLAVNIPAERREAQGQ